MRANRCSKKLERFNSILTNLEHGLNACWIRLSFRRGSLVNMSAEQQAHPHVRILLCARISFITSARPSTQNGWGMVRPAYCGELFKYHDISAKSSSPCCMVAVLVVSKYMCIQFSTVWVCALIPNYSPSRWRIECMWIHCERKWQDKMILMTKVILQILVTLCRIGIHT